MAPPPRAAETARFVTGSPMRHVLVLAGTGAIGMIAVFGVDLLNLFYISLLGHRAIAAAIGFAGAVSFLQVSFSIGMTIGVGALVSREIGAGHLDEARRLATSSLTVMVAPLRSWYRDMMTLSWSLSLLGAEGARVTSPLAICGSPRSLCHCWHRDGLFGAAAFARRRQARDGRDADRRGRDRGPRPGADPRAASRPGGAAISTMVSRLVVGAGWAGLGVRRHSMLTPLVPRSSPPTRDSCWASPGRRS